METSKETMENLMHSAVIANQELYSTITEDASILGKCDAAIPALLRDVAELRMDAIIRMFPTLCGAGLCQLFLRIIMSFKMKQKRYL